MHRLMVLLLAFSSAGETFATIEISSVFPNTVDDATMEQIELRNTGCESVDISGYSIEDISPKSYVFPSGTNISPKTNFVLPRSTSKIVLNNENETLNLKNPQGFIIDSFSYSTSQKGVMITDATIVDSDCSIFPEIINSGSGANETSSGEIIQDENTSSGSSNGSNTGSGDVALPVYSTLSGSIESGSGSISSSGSMDPPSGDITSSGSITQSGSSYTDSGATTVSGEIILTEPIVESGSLTPEKLYYSDRDNNGKIDTLEIVYPFTLSGIVHTGSISLFSRSGGLSLQKIDTVTGYILEGTLSGNILILKIQEGDISKITLHITNTTTSDLRLKSSGNLGFTSVGGKSPEHFLLTSSFDSYKQVFYKSTDTPSATSTGAVLIGNLGGTASGSVSSGEILNSSGITLTGSLIYESGLLLPISMEYDDVDGNQKIDTLEIRYSHVLTGSVLTGAIELYSNSGGLYSHQIATQSGYIISGALSGNILILKLLEGDIEKTNLRITSSTDSHLRLKSSGNLGFTSLGGQLPEHFFLTKSFENYKLVSRKGLSGIEVLYTENTGSGNIISSGATLSGGTLPEITYTIQSPTNASLSGAIWYCDQNNPPCRINFTLESIFTGGLLSKNYRCEISTGGAVINSCNPPTLYFNTPGAIKVEIFHKTFSASVILETPVLFHAPLTASKVTIPPVSNRPPFLTIDYDGKWKDTLYQVGEHHLICYAMTCSVNLSAEHSYDPDGDDVRYTWILNGLSMKHSKDPGAYSLPLGKHEIRVRAMDSYGSFSEIYYTVEVFEPQENIFLSSKKQKKESTKVASSTEESKKKKKKKMKVMIFFDPPEIELQNEKPDITFRDNTFYCKTKLKYCSLNFTLDTTIKGYTYEWIFPSATGAYISKNPRSFRFPLGYSETQVLARNMSGTIIWTHTFSVYAVKTTKTRSSSKTTKKSLEKPLEIEIEPIYMNDAEKSSEDPPYEYLFLSVFSFGLLGSRYFYKKLNT